MKSVITAPRIFIASILASVLTICGCGKIEPDPIPIPPAEQEKPEEGTEQEKPSWPEDQQGKSYIWDDTAVPEICIRISNGNWNYLLTCFDKNHDISPYMSCDVIFDKKGSVDTVRNVGIRLCDNNDGMRPEGISGDSHSATDAKWGLSNYQIDFGFYKKDKTLRNVKGIMLRSCVNDPTFAREAFCHELFGLYGIWTVGRHSYCRLSIHVEGDTEPAYLGVYQMTEPFDEDYICDRAGRFFSQDGYLWRCSAGAFLRDADIRTTADSGKGESSTYLLMNNQDRHATAEKQLSEFISNINKLNDKAFQAWIISVLDVRLFLRTYAVMVCAGLYDDYWNTGDNYYLFFNSMDEGRYNVFFIPYGFDKSLGSSEKAIMPDPGMQDPYHWGRSIAPLVNKLLQCEEFNEIYTDALYELTLPEAHLFNSTENIYIIQDLMGKVSYYTKNDTGLCMKAQDRPVEWSSQKRYNLTKDDENNFFRVRSERIRAMIGQ